jgi:periplasmic copper chaperone A
VSVNSRTAQKENIMRNLSCKLIFTTVAFVLGIGVLHAQSPSTIVVEKPFSRATPGGAQVGAGYMTITNKGTAADRLVSVSSPAAGKVQIHEMSMQDNVMKMRELTGGLQIEAGKTVSLSPGGYHLMMIELKAPLKAGDKVPVTLTFEKAGKVEVTLDVQAIGGQPAGGMSMPPDDGRHMHKM